MKESFLVGLVATGLLLVACGGRIETEQQQAVASEETNGQPRIVAVQDVFDFGKVKQGADVEHVFKIRNEGDAALRILKATGS